MRYANDRYKLSRWQYMEVRGLCRQYPKMRADAADLLGVSGVRMDDAPKATTVGMPVESAAIRRDKLLQRISSIETVAKEIYNGVWYEAIIKNCCYGVSYAHIPKTILPTSNSNAFYSARRLFYYRLFETINEKI